MKKQILILVLALFASLNLIKAQTPDPAALTQLPTYCVDATPVASTCVPAAGPNNPVAGQQYRYTVTVTNGDSPTIHWFATTDANFITTGAITANIQNPGGAYVMAAGTTYNAPGNTTPYVDITWEAFPATTDVFLVTYVTNGNGCPDNIKVYKIEPSHLFTLDIDRIAFDGAGTTVANHCVPPVFGASYNAGTGIVNMDYGVNYLFYVVNAANWAHSWRPTFELIVSNTTGSTTLAVDWAYPNQSHGASAIWHNTTVAGDIYTSVDAVFPATSGATGVGATGECIIVRVTVDHNQNEALPGMTVNLGIDGIMFDQVGSSYTNSTLGDIHHTDGGPTNPCPWFDGYTNDRMAYTLTARPEIQDASTPPATFILDDAE